MERTISLGMRGGRGWLVYGRGVGSGGGGGIGGVSLRGGAHEGRRRIGSKRGEADRPHRGSCPGVRGVWLLVLSCDAIVRAGRTRRWIVLCSLLVTQDALPPFQNRFVLFSNKN